VLIRVYPWFDCMSDIAIRVKNVTKAYQIYDKPQDRLKQSLWRGRKQFYREFKALDDVSFEVKKGETVGVIGRNGSGKSTLLQIICGTLAPTSGAVEVNGRVAALLELGAGFNPEFSGKENVYMNATILGLSKEEIDAKYDDIVGFAEIGDFIHQPVKTYSSGMYVRLAFAVAISSDPEILIVDEALSVGDELFQRKCFSRIESIRKSGASILFVSHSGGQIVELCDRALLLDTGEKLVEGLPKIVVSLYQKILYAPHAKQAKIKDAIRLGGGTIEKENDPSGDEFTQHQTKQETAKHIGRESFDPNLKPSSTIEYESKGAFINGVEIHMLDGIKVNNLEPRGSYRYCYNIHFDQASSNVCFGMLIKTISGIELGGSVSAIAGNAIPYVEAGSDYKVEFKFQCCLNAGVYFLNAGVIGDVNNTKTYLHRVVDAAMFRVLPDNDTTMTCVVDFCCESEVEEF